MDSTKKYNFVYKTTNLTNNKIYIGVHSTNEIEDGYLGSGHLLEKALVKYGKSNFKREILSSHKSREDALEEEKIIVTKDFIKNHDNYNLAIGGVANAGWSVWGGPHAERVRRILSEASQGYKNPDFVKRWLPVYESIAPLVCFYCCSTNLPDGFINKLVLSKTGFSVKINRVINYLAYKHYLDKGAMLSWSDYFGSGLIARGKAVKTNCIPILEKIPKTHSFYKSLHDRYLQDFREVLSLVSDMTISDSMILNDLVPISFKKGIRSRIKYYEYLGILKPLYQTRINIRERLPDSQRATGEKTIYSVYPIKNLLMIENDGEYNEYNIDFDGEIIQKTRLYDCRYADW